MLYILSKRIIYRLDPILQDNEQIEICVYGCEIFLYTVISTACLLLIAFMMNALIQGAIIIAVFYTNQSFGGGFHAKTHLWCFTLMAFCLMLALYVSFFDSIYFPVGWFSILILTAHPLILHSNKNFLAYKATKYRLQSQIVIVIESLLFIFFSFTIPYYSVYISKGLFLSAISRLIAYAKRK